MSTDDLKQYLAIDKHALDDELVQQPSMFFKISEAYVEAVAERDALKEQLAVTDAILDNGLRQTLGEKCTEARIKNRITANESHLEATDKYLAAKTKADQLQALKEAFQQRGYMLRDLAQLFVANYYGTDSVRTTQKTDEAVYKQRRANRS